MRREDESGFTLIELMTVMVILGVLAAIALPTFLGQKEGAFRATASSDLRTIITTQLSRLTNGLSPTGDLAELQVDGYRPSDGVVPHLAVSGEQYRVCVTHTALDEWLVYDSATNDRTWSATNACT